MQRLLPPLEEASQQAFRLLLGGGVRRCDTREQPALGQVREQARHARGPRTAVALLGITDQIDQGVIAVEQLDDVGVALGQAQELVVAQIAQDVALVTLRGVQLLHRVARAQAWPRVELRRRLWRRAGLADRRQHQARAGAHDDRPARLGLLAPALDRDRRVAERDAAAVAQR